MIDQEDIEKQEAYRFSLQQRVESLFYSPDRVARIQDIARILSAEEFVDIDRKKGVISFRAKEYVDSLVEKYKETDIELQLPTAVEIENTVVFPAGEGEIQTGSGKGVETKREFPRNALFIELLSEHNIPYENPRISQTTKDMMRDEGYTVYFLPTLEKTVCVNNEEGNTTIILFGTQSYDDARQIFKHYTKDQIREECTSIAVCIDWDHSYTDNPDQWKKEIYITLTQKNPIQTPTTRHTQEHITVTNTNTREKENIADKILQMEEAFSVWQALEEKTRGAFNTEWLRKNRYAGLYNWAHRNGGIGALVKQCSEELQKAFEKQKQWTKETAAAELEQAFSAWQTSREETRETFNTGWLENNGYAGLYVWAYRNGGIEALVKQCSEELQEAFKKIEQIKDRTQGTAQAELEQAFSAWQALAKETRGKFNTKWLKKNGYTGLYVWAYRNGGIEALVRQCSEEIQDAFAKPEQVKDRIQGTAQAELEQAFSAWQALAKETRGKFNTKWLQKNGYKGLHIWAYRNGGIEALVRQCSKEIQRTFFEKRHKTN